MARVVYCVLAFVALFVSHHGIGSDRGAQNSSDIQLADGKFGKALDARQGGLLIETRPEQREPPISVDLWARLDSAKQFNILVASEPKASSTHWELYTYAQSGLLSVYLPGRGGEFKSDADLCDGKWHYLGMALEPERVRLYADGKQVLDKPLKKLDAASSHTPMGIGRLVEGGLGCDGLIDELRITSGLIAFEEVPQKAPAGGRGMLGLWRFNEVAAHQTIRDESKMNTPALLPRDVKSVAVAQSTTGNKTVERPGHYSESVIGFQWQEQDSASDRWQKTEIGRFLASLVGLPQGVVRKGLSIRVGKEGEATVCYDTQFCRLRGWWTGGLLKFGPMRFGIIETPQPNGTLRYSVGEGKEWGDKEVRHESLHVHDDRTLLTYRVGKSLVREHPWCEKHGDFVVFTRNLEFEPSDERLSWTLLETKAESSETGTIGDRSTAILTSKKETWRVAVIGDDPAGPNDLPLVSAVDTVTGVGKVELTIHKRPTTLRRKILYAAIPADDEAKNEAWKKLVAQSLPPDILSLLMQPGPRRWPEDPVTSGVVGSSDGPLAVDTLTLPFDNKFQAQFFTSGHDFFTNGDIAVCTVHGDVWRVSGVDDKLKKLTWKRYATGLFQPLGLKILEDRVYVLGRDQITRLVDANSDGEADRYENVSNLHETSKGGHDYVTGLEVDSAGYFHFAHATQGAVRSSPDGRKLEIVATGFRNPNGSGLGPHDEITVAPQEGNWTPASFIALVRSGQHYGFGGPQVTATRPQGYDPPLCWIPRRRDNSSGGQVWVPDHHWGPLSGQMLHLSYGQCRAMLVLQEKVGDVLQGGTSELPLPTFDSGIMRGRFNPHDGHLYLTGLRGWTTAAVQDGCLQRVRYTGKPLDVPVNLKSHKNGVAIEFSRPLNREVAEDVDNYFLEQWDYLYSKEYGSRDYKVTDPKQEGRDEIAVGSATLLDDQRTVFLEIPNLQPVMQLSIGLQLRAADEAPVRDTIYYTLNAIGSESMPEAKLHRRPRTGQLSAAEQARLRPGILVRFRQDSGTGWLDDARVERIVAHYVPANSPPSPFLTGKPFRAKYEGYLRVPLGGDYRFRVAGTGQAELKINGEVVTKFVSADNASVAAELTSEVHLRGGYNRIELAYESPPPDHAQLRLFWSHESFAEEPVPATVLHYRRDDPQLLKMTELRAGRISFAEHQCQRCHSGAFDKGKNSNGMLELLQSPPDLQRAALLSDAWLAKWIANPGAHRAEALMPRLFTDDEAGRQQAADIAAYVRSLVPQKNDAPLKHETDGDAIAAGELLFEKLGCLVCHQLKKSDDNDPGNRRSLQDVKSRWSDRAALVSFLRRPQEHQPAIRMPDFMLSEKEAAALTEFLWSSEPIATELPAAELPVGDSTRGKDLFRAKGCQNCHTLDGNPLAESQRLKLSTKIVPRACLGATSPASATWPVHSLNADERQALLNLLNSDQSSLTRDAAAETSQRLFGSLRCGACHDRDQARSPRGKLILEEGNDGHAPEVLPNLTWAGEKLEHDYLVSFLRGETGTPDRPTRTWLSARMPRFNAYAAALAEGLAAEHGLPSQSPESFVLDQDRVELGQQLLESAGLDCRQCHGLGNDPPRGDKETLLAPGINFSAVRERVRHEYFGRFLLAPPRFDIGSKMPKLAADGKMTKVSHIHGGDAREQFESIWHFLQGSQTKSSPTPAAK